MTKKNKDMKKETKENLELLFKDLCGRLPYNVIGRRKWIAPMTNSPEQTKQALSPRDLEAIQSLIEHGLAYVNLSDGREIFLDKYEFKPYLRPLSDMTAEEFAYIKQRWVFTEKCRDENDIMDVVNRGCVEVCDAHSFVEWLNANHFDYRGLIKIRLAFKATKGMYDIKQENNE